MACDTRCQVKLTKIFLVMSKAKWWFKSTPPGVPGDFLESINDARGSEPFETVLRAKIKELKQPVPLKDNKCANGCYCTVLTEDWGTNQKPRPTDDIVLEYPKDQGVSRVRIPVKKMTGIGYGVCDETPPPVKDLEDDVE